MDKSSVIAEGERLLQEGPFMKCTQWATDAGFKKLLLGSMTLGTWRQTERSDRLGPLKLLPSLCFSSCWNPCWDPSVHRASIIVPYFGKERSFFCIPGVNFVCCAERQCSLSRTLSSFARRWYLNSGGEGPDVSW